MTRKEICEEFTTQLENTDKRKVALKEAARRLREEREQAALKENKRASFPEIN